MIPTYPLPEKYINMEPNIMELAKMTTSAMKRIPLDLTLAMPILGLWNPRR